MVLRSFSREAFRCCLGEDFVIDMIFVWDYFLPSTLSFVGGFFGQLLCHRCLTYVYMCPVGVHGIPFRDLFCPFVVVKQGDLSH